MGEGTNLPELGGSGPRDHDGDGVKDQTR
jgi:hypothetical protein